MELTEEQKLVTGIADYFNIGICDGFRHGAKNDICNSYG